MIFGCEVERTNAEMVRKMTALLPKNLLKDNATVVRARLQAVIETGSLPADGRLPTERDLSESMGVGRRAVRSASSRWAGSRSIWAEIRIFAMRISPPHRIRR